MHAPALTDTVRHGPLQDRYTKADLAILTPAERARFVTAPEADPSRTRDLAFELLYRLEPHLYDRLARAEILHPGISRWLPARVDRVVEVGAGSGRLTVELAARCSDLVAIEPAAPIRRILEERLRPATGRIQVVHGFFDSLPVGNDWADLVVTCSALTNAKAHGGDLGIREMERVCRPGGMVVIVWPNHLDWLRARGYAHVSFEGPMEMEFGTVTEAVELVEIFYPHAAADVRSRADRRVPYELLGVNPPRDLAWKEIIA